MDAKLEDQGLYECEVTEPNGKYALVTVVYIFEKINSSKYENLSKYQRKVMTWDQFSEIGDELVDRVMKAINEGISDIVSGQDVPAVFFLYNIYIKFKSIRFLESFVKDFQNPSLSFSGFTWTVHTWRGVRASRGVGR